jgi:hypothetical protein
VSYIIRLKVVYQVSIESDDGDESECGEDKEDTEGILLHAPQQTGRAD